MSDPQQGLPVAILVAAGFEETQLTETQKTLLATGIDAKIISPDGGLVQGWHEGGWGHHFMADSGLSDVLSADFSALLIPHGTRSAASLKDNPHAVRLLRAFIDAGKTVAIIGDAANLMLSAELAAGRQFSQNPGAAEALTQAGATLMEDDIFVDGQMISAVDTVNISKLLTIFLKSLNPGEPVEAAA